MGEFQTEPVLKLMAAFSRHVAALDWAQEKAKEVWGPTALKSKAFDFAETDYYQQSMGAGLKKQFWVFEQLADQGELADWKQQSGAWEKEYASLGRHAESRPLNVDPGYLSRGKLVLASTKDHSHRIYLRDGIFAEVTLYYKEKHWQARDWTFPDYRRDDYQQFFSQCRDYLRGRLQEDQHA